jgi:hypothetical protein
MTFSFSVIDGEGHWVMQVVGIQFEAVLGLDTGGGFVLETISELPINLCKTVSLYSPASLIVYLIASESFSR